MKIEFWKGGWYIVNGLRKGPYLTFKAAFDMLDLLKLKPN